VTTGDSYVCILLKLFLTVWELMSLFVAMSDLRKCNS